MTELSPSTAAPRAPTLASEIRVAVTAAGNPRDAARWSGMAAGLVRGLEALGVDVCAVRAEPPARVGDPLVKLGALMRARPGGSGTALRGDAAGRVRQAVRHAMPAAYHGRALTALRSALAARSLRATGEVAATIQFGSEYALPSGTPYVTFDDATVAGAWRLYPYPYLAAMPEDVRGALIAHQRAVYRGARRNCLMNHWAARSAVEDYGVSPDAVAVVGIGRNHTPTWVPRTWDAPRFLFVGKDWTRKNGDAVIRAFLRIRDTNPKATLDVAGGHPRLGLPGVREHGLLDLAVAGDRARMDELFQGATCLVMPSRAEPTGIVHAEALAAGIPSIGTTAGGVATIIGDAGTIVDPGDDDAIAESMASLADPATVAAAAERAQARAPLFTWQAVAERVLRVALTGRRAGFGDLAELL